ncbi:MAG: 6,7-dimethyl-8-ribityllumazine synthase [Planctomycetota bacterium]
MPEDPSTASEAPTSHSPRLGPVLCVVSAYNGSITSRLLEGARAEFARRGGSPEHFGVVEAPGAYELPALAAEAARGGLFSAVVCLGCVVRGETPHDEHIARAVAHEVARISSDSGVPVAFGVLTVLDSDQAEARAGGAHGNKGEEAMAAALDTAAALAAIRDAAATRDAAIEFRLNDSKPDKPRGGSQ